MFMPCRDRSRAARDFQTQDALAGGGSVSGYYVIGHLAVELVRNPVGVQKASVIRAWS